MTRMEALRSYTQKCGVRWFRTRLIKGLLRVGKLADMAVLSKDNHGTPNIRSRARTLYTIVGGRASTGGWRRADVRRAPLGFPLRTVALPASANGARLQPDHPPRADTQPYACVHFDLLSHILPSLLAVGLTLVSGTARAGAQDAIPCVVRRVPCFHRPDASDRTRGHPTDLDVPVIAPRTRCARRRASGGRTSRSAPAPTSARKFHSERFHRFLFQPPSACRS